MRTSPYTKVLPVVDDVVAVGKELVSNIKPSTHSIQKLYYCIYNIQGAGAGAGAPQELLIQFYSAIIESVLCTSINVWFSSATKSDLRRLQRVVRTAERIIGTTLPTLQELYLSRVSKRAGKITLNPSHPAHSLFELLPSGHLYRAPSTRTTRHRNSFFPQAIHLMNTWH